MEPVLWFGWFRADIVAEYAELFWRGLQMTIGITLPFLPPYLKTLSLSATQVGLLMSIGPALAIICPPL